MRSRLSSNSWVLTSPVAHRGLHGEGAGENTFTAYQRAIDKGYPIEMDVQLTSDGVPVCFHDDNLVRVTGENALIWDKTYDQIKHLKISGTNDGIPLFSEFLSFVNGKVPLMIEIKKQKSANSGIEKKVVDLLKDYKGEYVIQSFDPRIMAKIKKLNPQIIRGQLGGGVIKGQIPFLQYVVVKNMLLNFLSKPDFINYDLNCAPLKKNLPVIYYTVRTEEQLKKLKSLNANFVFENVKPE